MTTESTTSVGSASDVLQLTLPLHQFIDIYLGSQDCAYISEELGYLIDTIDITKQYCVIEFGESDDTKEILCRIWRPNAWKNSSIRWYQLKEQAQKDREAGWLLKENILIVSKALAKLTAMPIDNMRETAYKIIRERSGTKLAALGITLKEKL